MIEINLLPEEMRVSDTGGRFPKISAKRAIGLSIAAFVVLQVIMTVFSVLMQLESMRVKSELAKLQKEYVVLIQRKNEIRVLKARLKQIGQMTARPFYWAKFMNELSDSVTKGVWLRQLTITETDASSALSKVAQAAQSATAKAAGKAYYLKLEGSDVAKGQETASIGKFMKELKSNALFIELFESIELSTINQRKIKDIDVYDFSLVGAFKKGKMETS